MSKYEFITETDPTDLDQGWTTCPYVGHTFGCSCCSSEVELTRKEALAAVEDTMEYHYKAIERLFALKTQIEGELNEQTTS